VDIRLENSIVGLAIQFAGIVLVAVLCFLLTRAIRRRFLYYWTIGWTCLAFALFALLIAFWIVGHSKTLYTLYFFGEYAFGCLLVAGCRNHANGVQLTKRDSWLLLPGAVVAVVLPQLSDRFNLLLVPHTTIIVAFWVVSYWVLCPARRHQQWGPGLRVVSVALVLLTLDFLQYIPVCAYAEWTGQTLPFAYLKYSALYDLILEILLAFGMVMIVMESVRRELAEANQELAAASKRLRTLAEQDPLTAALNRHAFYSLLESKRGDGAATVAGCVVVLDVDGLKSINDTLGHAVGDDAIRAVASAIRSVIRADDLLFRWGGDEFLVLLVGLKETDARSRLDRVNALLAKTCLHGLPEPIAVGISYGVASFTEASALEQAIEQADREMYERKQAQKVRIAEERVGTLAVVS
jgi:diguanylate cyclase (GGDEF)-like protein